MEQKWDPISFSLGLLKLVRILSCSDALRSRRAATQQPSRDLASLHGDRVERTGRSGSTLDQPHKQAKVRAQGLFPAGSTPERTLYHHNVKCDTVITLVIFSLHTGCSCSASHNGTNPARR